MGPMQLQLPIPPTPELDRLIKERDRLRQAEHSPFTRRGYAYNWKHFASWCEEAGRKSLPATEDTLSLYLTYLLVDKAKRVSTAARSAAAVSCVHQQSGYPTPYTRVARSVLMGARRERFEPPRQMTPVTVGQVREIATLLNREGTAVALRNRTILLIGFASALRRINLVALDMDDISRCPKGILLRIKREKQDRECQGRAIAIPFAKDETGCPVRALDDWLHLRGSDPGPVFIRLDRRAPVNARLSLQRMSVVVKALIRKLGIDPNLYGPHSLRSGLITEAGLAGISPLVIAEQSGHKSLDSVRRYFRPVDQFAVNAAGLLGF